MGESKRDLWIRDLANEIDRKIDAALAMGIAHMPAGRLWDSLWISSPNEPTGEDAGQVARNDFDELIASVDEYRAFVEVEKDVDS